jgi:general secretion pathway protein C
MNPWRATVWIANVLLLGAIAYAAAITTSLLLERALRVEPAPPTAARAEAPRPALRETRPLTAFQDVLERNIFGARRRQPPARKDEPVARPAPVAEPKPLPEPFQVTLTGTFLAGDQSFAMVIGQNDHAERVYRVGDCVPQIGDEPSAKCAKEQARLTRIELDRIVILKDGKMIPVEIGQGPPPQAGAAPAPVQPPGDRTAIVRERIKSGRRPVLTAERPGVAEPAPERPAGAAPERAAGANPPEDAFPSERVGNSYQITVPNAEVDKAFENFSEIVAQAAAVPIIENGQPLGFQLRRIRPGSIFERLGLENLDLIRGVNGQSLTTADQALRLFTLFRNEREIVLDIKRRDENIQLVYTVQ